MEIVKYPNDILNKVLSPVVTFDDQLHQQLDAMYSTMLRVNGIGLAANQVGLNTSMFVMRTKRGQKFEVINPQILHKSDAKALLSEGCLSAPDIFDIVEERSDGVEVTFQDRNGIEQREVFTGIDAVCFQHEYDHLLGVFFFSKLKLSRQVRRALTRKGYSI